MLNTNTQHAAAAPRRHLSASVRRLAEMRLSASQDGQDSPAILIDADAELSETLECFGQYLHTQTGQPWPAAQVAQALAWRAFEWIDPEDEPGELWSFQAWPGLDEHDTTPADWPSAWPLRCAGLPEPLEWLIAGWTRYQAAQGRPIGAGDALRSILLAAVQADRGFQGWMQAQGWVKPA